MSTPDIIVVNPRGRLLDVITEPATEKVPNISPPVPKCPRLITRPLLIVMKEEPKKNGICNFEGGCDVYASFGYPTTRKRERCATHKTPDMVNVVSKFCEHPGCTVHPVYNFPGATKVKYCVTHKEQGMIDIKTPKCKFPGCTVTSSFNVPGETMRIYCATHRELDMINVRSKKCAEPGCLITPFFNFPGEPKGLYCATHRKKEMVNVINEKCAEPGCTTLPSFNLPGTTSGLYCAQHKKPDMISVGHKTCSEPGCRTQPNFNVNGETKPLYCTIHKKPGMVNVMSNRCQEPDCLTHPVFNLPGETSGVFCSIHKKPNMVDVVSKRCQGPDCLIIAGYGKLFGPKIHCATHKSQHEYKDNNPKCSASGCTERPLYTDKGNNYPLRCEAHHLPQDKNVIERPCISCNLPNFINEATMMCNDCTEFFVGKNNRGEKERRVREVIEAQVHKPLGLKWLVVDRPIPDGCSKRRPDTATDYSHSIEIVETDENQHRIYSHDCEIARMATIHQDLGGIPVIFIRYNPDSYKVNGSIVRKKQNREQVLVRLMHDLKNVKAVKYALLVCYLFYDNFDGTIRFSSIDYTKNPIEIKEVTDMFE